MDIYITFYSICHSKLIRLNNGFSFGRSKKSGDVDLLFNGNNLETPKLIQDAINKHNPDKIWVSITYNYEAITIYKIVDERWIIGGPLVYWSKGKDNFSDFFPTGPTYVFTSMEEYLGNELSSDFDPYFVDYFTENYNDVVVQYNICLSLRWCYWSKCTFCTYHGLGKDRSWERCNIEKIIESALGCIGGNTYSGQTCTPALTSGLLKRISKANTKHAFLISFMRPDESILDAVRQVDDLTGQEFIIGAEGFAQGIVDELNKGFKVSTLVELTDEIVKRNGGISFSLMFNYTFLTKEMVAEYIETAKKIENIGYKYDRPYLLGTNIEPSIIWQDKYNAEKFGFPSVRVTHPWSKGLYMSRVPEDSDQKMFNDVIFNYIKNSEVLKPW